MEPRRSDPRIYIVTFLFLSCIISGGVLLGLDVLLPQGNPQYLTAGLVLVGVPWLFWLLAYIYTCIIKPCTAEIPPGNPKNVNADPEVAKIPRNGALESPVTPRTPREGEKHVQFGNVTVIRNEEEQQQTAEEAEQVSFVRRGDDSNVDHVDRDEKGSESSGDCDNRPLRLSTAYASH